MLARRTVRCCETRPSADDACGRDPVRAQVGSQAAAVTTTVSTVDSAAAAPSPTEALWCAGVAVRDLGLVKNLRANFDVASRALEIGNV